MLLPLCIRALFFNTTCTNCYHDERRRKAQQESNGAQMIQSHAECRWPDLEVDVDDRNL